MLFKNIFLSTILILIVCMAIWANVVNDKRDVLVYDDLNYLTLNYIDLDSLKINFYLLYKINQKEIFLLF